MLKEAPSPFAHDLPAHIQSCRDFGIGVSFGGEQHDLGSHH